MSDDSSSKHHLLIVFVAALVAASLACSDRGSGASSADPVRLVDAFTPDAVSGGTPDAARVIPPTVWRFDGEPPSPAPTTFPATRGWDASPSVTGLAIRDDRLIGRTTGDFPIVHVERRRGLEDRDLLHAVEVRMRVSAGTTVSFQGTPGERVDFAQVQQGASTLPWNLRAPLTPGDEVQTYTLTPLTPVTANGLRHLMLRPTDVANASFEIESVRLIFRKEHLAGIPSGIGWQGLGEIYRESLTARSPETIAFTARLPGRPWLDLAIGTIEDGPVTFRVRAQAEGAREADTLLEHTVSTSHRWEVRPIDLERFGGKTVKLSFSLASEQGGAVGFWGSPVIRTRGGAARASGGSQAPQGVILIQADTLRRDHLSMYGYRRETAPTLNRFAAEGVLFNNYMVQATWTKVSTPTLMTSLYPTTHGVLDFPHRLPASAHTLAESFRSAGWATVSMTSILFTGQFTNLHQGFEELHEDGSLPNRGSSKTAREYVDRLTTWLERHKDEPFFAFLHIFDPHDPYEPYRPYDAIWANPAHKDEHVRQLAEVRKVIANPVLRLFGMPTRAELDKAGIDPESFVQHDRDWYDGSIRAMDVEIARLLQSLRTLGLDERTLVVFLSDHGEEFLEHGRMFHGQTVYGELTRVPLIMRWPGGLSGGRIVNEVVQSIDVMPTLLALGGIEAPQGLQGQSLTPLLSAEEGKRAEWRRRPAITEKAIVQPGPAPPPHETESYAITDEQWKLVRNVVRAEGTPEFELYDAVKDPLDKTNIAQAHPDVVDRLAKALDGWKAMAEKAKLASDAEGAKNLTPEQLQRLRSLGYVK
jgi:arylsulfatase A-like enzyme